MSSEVYTIKPACVYGVDRYDVVRTAPTVVAKELRWEEAVALARDLNDQINRMENPK